MVGSHAECDGMVANADSDYRTAMLVRLVMIAMVLVMMTVTMVSVMMSMIMIVMAIIMRMMIMVLMLLVFVPKVDAYAMPHDCDDVYEYACYDV